LFIPIRRPSYSPRPPSRRSSDLLQKPLPAPLNSPFGETPVLCREFAWTLRSLQRQEDTGTGRRNLHVRQPFPLSSGQQRRLNRRSEEHTSELQSRENLVCRLLLE